jgi:exodeoxyribonuclease VII large subunit
MHLHAVSNSSSLRENQDGGLFTAQTHVALSVSQLTAWIKRAIESTMPPTVHVVGEISNLKRHSSGHLYLTLKDAASELSCVMWRSEAAKLRFSLQDGLEVIATGGVEVFERAGRYQLYIRRLEPRGVGALELAFRQLCEKLKKQGFFEAARKRALPRVPQRIAIITSPTGAAISDILRTIERRFSCAQALLYPVRVQGPEAAVEIAAAIAAVNVQARRLGGIDVIIVGRGGGSLEDLWSFNEEVVARAILASVIPVVSAVGHETDVTIADLVADVRAATPTAAAELVTPVLSELIEYVGALATRFARCLQAKADLSQARYAGVLQREPLRAPAMFVRRREQVLDEACTRGQRGLNGRLRQARQRMDALEAAIQRIAPHAYLRGVALRLRDAEHGLSISLHRRLAVDGVEAMKLARRLDRASPLHRLPRLTDRVATWADQLPALTLHRMRIWAERLRSQEQLLGAVSHQSVLARGFSITRTRNDRRIVRSVGDVQDGQRLLTQLADGEFESETRSVKQRELFE